VPWLRGLERVLCVSYLSLTQMHTNARQTGCWNEAAGIVGCDPNTDDACLCGEFFDEVAACTGTTCGIGENLRKLFSHGLQLGLC